VVEPAGGAAASLSSPAATHPSRAAARLSAGTAGAAPEGGSALGGAAVPALARGGVSTEAVPSGIARLGLTRGVCRGTAVACVVRHGRQTHWRVRTAKERGCTLAWTCNWPSFWPAVGATHLKCSRQQRVRGCNPGAETQ